jgi:hypothetical protein
VTTAQLSLSDLSLRGEAAIAHYVERHRPPSSTLEWLGIAVGQLPELTANARTADEVHLRSRSQTVAMRRALLEQLMESLATAIATVEAARDALPGHVNGVEDYAELLESAHAGSPRRAETMIGGYASFLGGAIEAAAALADAEAAGSERQARAHAELLGASLSNAVGDLLAYARIVARLNDSLRD